LSELSHRKLWAALLLLWAAVYGGALLSPGLLDDADATHAEAAREMARTGDYVTLKVNGVRYLEKAPLPYWMVATSYKIFGENEFATRLPIALGLLATMGLAWKWTRRAFGDRAGGYAALFVATSVGFFLFTRIFIPEVLLSLFIALSLYLFLSALETKQAWRWYTGYAVLALAVLTKGLVALVFTGGAVFFYLLASGDWRRWREFRLATGLLLLFVIAAPWHILAGLRNTGGTNGHGFFWFYFINEHFLRFLGRRLPKDYNKQPFLVFWFGHIIWLFPWSLFLPLAISDLWQRWRERQPELDFAARTRLMCVIYAALILVFFSISTNQEYYTFPAYLPIIILLAAALAGAEEGTSRWLLGAHAVLAVIGVAVAVVLAAGLWSSRELAFVPDISTVLAKRGVGNYTLSMSHFFDLTGESFAALRLPAMLAAAALLIGPLVAVLLRKRKQNAVATSVVGVTLAMFLVAAGIAFGRFGSYLSSKHIALELNQRLSANDKMMIYGDQAAGSSLLFYMKRPICLVNGATTSMQFGSTFADAPKIFLDDAGLRQAWTSGERVYLFLPSERRERADAAIAGLPKYAVIERSEKIVYSNHP
jgi:4-amino-4-deoxy-L-arabinose transferase-like glycosyltransferase